MTTGEGRDVGQQVNLQIRFYARFSFHHNRPISCSAQCRHYTNPSVNFQLSFLVTCEQDTHILKLLHLEEHFVSIPECALVFFSAENHGLRLERTHCFTRSCELLQCEVETTLKLKESCHLQKVETISYTHQDGKSRKSVYIIYEQNW